MINKIIHCHRELNQLIILLDQLIILIYYYLDLIK